MMRNRWAGMQVVALVVGLGLLGPVRAWADTFVLASAQVVTSSTGESRLLLKASGPIAFAVVEPGEVGAVPDDGTLRLRLYGVDPGGVGTGGLAPFGLSLQAFEGGTLVTVRATVAGGQRLEARAGGSPAELEIRMIAARP